MLITEDKIIKSYYQALIERKPNYVGVFYVAVKTTSVFCISTCRARKPKIENVAFYTQLNEVIEKGFRPCKICKPTENASLMPEDVTRAMTMFQSDSTKKVSDKLLAENGLSAVKIRRWFKQHYGITFQAYQRMYRINKGFKTIKEGEKTTYAAYSSGYDSLSGFGHTFKKYIGKSPANSAGTTLILVKRITTPLGPMLLAATQHGLCLSVFMEGKSLSAAIDDIVLPLNASLIMGENHHLVQGAGELEEYFAGKRLKFDVVLDENYIIVPSLLRQELMKVPFGQTITSDTLKKNVVKQKKLPSSTDFFKQNHMAIIVPSHRIVDGSEGLGGATGDEERKKWLVNHEKKTLDF